MTGIKIEKLPQTANNLDADNDSHCMEVDKTTWDEEQLENALEALKEIYIHLRELRTLIPRLVAPLTVRQPSQADMLFKKFSTATTTANEELKRFRRLVEDDYTRKIFEYVNESRTNAKDVLPWRITEHPDWLIRDNLKCFRGAS